MKGTKSIKKIRTPLSRMLSRGGIVYVPREAYLKRLQRLYGRANRRAHSNSLYPGLAHVAATNDADLAAMFCSILAVSEAGRNLHGLESIFLSCLQGLQVRGNRPLALAGIAAWVRYESGKRDWPLIVIDRASNQMKYISANRSGAILKSITSASLVRSTVWSVLKSLENKAAIGSTAGFHSPADDTDAMDCKDKVQAWASVAAGVFSLVGGGFAYAASKNSDSIGRWADAIGLGGGIYGAIYGIGSGLVQLFGCKDETQNTGLSSTDINKIVTAVQSAMSNVDADAVASAILTTLPATLPDGDPSDPSEWNDWPGESTPSDMGDWNVPDPDGTVTSWGSQDDPSDPPPDPVDSGEPGDMPNPDGPDSGGPASSWATPNPDDSGDSHSVPPGSHWPHGELPNPDDPGGGGPVALPNGAVFLTSFALSRIAARAPTAVSVQLNNAQNGFYTSQFSSSATALSGGSVT